MTVRLRRSELSVPGSNPKMIAKSAESDADLVFLDLEDATAPAKKVEARKNVIDGLNNLDWGRKVRAVRVNDHATEWAVHDVVSVMEGAGENLDVIILPKVKEPRDVWFFETMLDGLEKKLGLSRPIGLEVLIEEAEGLGNAESIAKSSPRLEAMILGFGDLAASLGMRMGFHPDFQYPGDMWHAHRVRLIAACRAAGIDAIDGPFGNYGDDEGYRQQAGYATMLGAVGKWCIHPNQIEPANDVFAPSSFEIKNAKEMIDAYHASVAAGDGAGSQGGSLIDAVVLRMFEPVLERARLTGRL